MALLKISALALLLLMLWSVDGRSNLPSPPRTNNLPPKVFNVMSYGARNDGTTDNRKAFLLAWNDACAYPGRGRILIPRGTFALSSVTFVGGCNGTMTFLLQGTLRAPSDPQLFFTNTWIGFRYVDWLTVKGGGFLDGQGLAAWKYNDCNRNSNCKPLPTTMRLDFVTNSWIHHIRSLNSKNTHFNIFACDKIKLSNVRIDAPDESPNTDGIHIGTSTNIEIHDSAIHTGDDCISMVSGSSDIDIKGVVCGPGHGISIGSIGRSHAHEDVSNISVRNTTFVRTQNGVRIKTWAPSLQSLVSNITFEDIHMIDVANPIFIDQAYCPFPYCKQAESSVQIQDVLIKNIHGTSSSKVAVKLHCSKSRPCKNVKLVDISLAFNDRIGASLALCLNVLGTSFGTQNPGGCL